MPNNNGLYWHSILYLIVQGRISYISCWIPVTTPYHGPYDLWLQEDLVTLYQLLISTISILDLEGGNCIFKDYRLSPKFNSTSSSSVKWIGNAFKAFGQVHWDPSHSICHLVDPNPLLTEPDCTSFNGPKILQNYCRLINPVWTYYV